MTCLPGIHLFPLLFKTADCFHRRRHRHNPNALMFLEVEQMPISRDDEFGLGGERAGEHLVVIGIIEYGRGNDSGMHHSGQ